ncbi:hypothetical protein DNTS_003318 [Danionella cerebrum]|uniref:Uncharacterized protein n=1 Tax=Danionella cerebrum TaxID=2873325 RepID=A0A553MVR5_9TELE|nr:hypothetical protein DNTS_003318 [Danionella translucida]
MASNKDLKFPAPKPCMIEEPVKAVSLEKVKTSRFLFRSRSYAFERLTAWLFLWITSRKSVGLSCTGLVKICSR